MLLASHANLQDLADAASRASQLGIMAGTFAIAIPLVLYFVVFHLSPPTTARAYAFRFGLWPLVVVSYTLGGPLARSFSGIQYRYAMDLPMQIQGVLMLSAFLYPIFWLIGRARSKKRFPQSATETPP